MSMKGIFRKKTVKAIIYTHHHDCHIHGASVFADTYTEIIAHENLMTTLYYDWYNQLYPGRLIGGAKMMGSLFTTDDPVYDTNRDGLDDRWYYDGGLVGDQIHGNSGFLAPTTIVRDELKTTIAGVKVHLFSAPGETRDVLVVWLPVRRTLIQIANLYEAFPAINTLRGITPETHYPI